MYYDTTNLLVIGGSQRGKSNALLKNIACANCATRNPDYAVWNSFIISGSKFSTPT